MDKKERKSSDEKAEESRISDILHALKLFEKTDDKAGKVSIPFGLQKNVSFKTTAAYVQASLLEGYSSFSVC